MFPLLVGPGSSGYDRFLQLMTQQNQCYLMHITVLPPAFSAPAPSFLQISPRTLHLPGFCSWKARFGDHSWGLCTPSVGRAGSCRRREGSEGFPAGGHCLQLPLGRALPTLFLHHLGSLGHRVPAAGGWEEEKEEGQAVPQQYLAGAGLPLGRTGGVLLPAGSTAAAPWPRRRRQGHRPRESPGPSASSARPRTPESLKRLFFPGSGAGGKGQEKEGGAGGEKLAGQEPGGVLARTGKEPVPVQPGRLRESRQRSGRAHWASACHGHRAPRQSHGTGLGGRAGSRAGGGRWGLLGGGWSAPCHPWEGASAWAAGDLQTGMEPGRRGWKQQGFGKTRVQGQFLHQAQLPGATILQSYPLILSLCCRVGLWRQGRCQKTRKQGNGSKKRTSSRKKRSGRVSLNSTVPTRSYSSSSAATQPSMGLSAWCAPKIIRWRQPSGPFSSFSPSA